MPLEVEISFESRALALLLTLYSYIFSKKKYFLDTPMKKLHNRTEAFKETSYMADYNSSYFSFSLDWPVTKNQKLNSIKQQMPTNFCCCHFSLKTKEVRLYSFKIETKKHRYFVFGF